MDKIASLKLKYKMAVLLSIPLLGMIFIAQSKILEDLTALNESSAVMAISQLGITSSRLIHELQKEREMSASYLSSQGQSFQSEMQAQRSNVDQRVEELHLHLEKMNVESFGSSFSEQRNTAVAYLDELPEKRDAIVNLTISAPVAFGYYSAINAAFLDMMSYTARLGHTGETSRAAAAHLSLMRGKDRAGIERAIMNTTFANDAFDPGMYDIFITLVSAQDTYFSVFNELATDEQRQYAQATLQGNFIDETDAMREIVTDLGDFGGYGIDADRWFRMQTGKIDLFKKVENRLATDLIEIANTDKADAKSALMLSLVQVAIVILATAILGYIISRAVTRPLRRCVEVADSIASGNLDNEIASTSTDEMGQLLGTLDTMQTNLRESIEADRLQSAANGRVKQALDNVSASVMVTDANLDIIYLNDAVTELFQGAESDIRKDLPNFSASGMMGSCIDIFHKNPAHQRDILSNLNSTHTTEITLGGRTMKIVINPVFGEDCERLGAVIEWTDRTEELAVEKEVQNVVDSAVGGDLTSRISEDEKEGFFERLSVAINKLVSVQMDVVGKIQVAANSVKTGADEISQGNANLSQRTEEQASSLEETASSMEEMTSTVKQNADNAGEANQLAMAAREQAEKGGMVVNQAVEAMKEINASSKKISDIIGVIDEIAFQTNLLALNASVEAARAGDQGRGFAVVASEVRNLAGRSATAAKEIKELIVDSAAKVDEGSRLVNESGETLQEIVNGVKKVTDIVGEIAAASQEQSAGIDQVNKAIVQLDELTQQNAALVEEASAASESMGEQADDLNQMMTFFTVDHDKQGTAAASDSSPPGGVERRSANRSWTGRKTAEESEDVAAPAPKSKAAAGGGDAEWEEF